MLDWLKPARGLVVPALFGLAVTLWVRPATEGGLLLLFVVSTALAFVLVSLLRLGLRVLARIGAARGRPAAFVSRRAADEDRDPRP